MRLSVLIILNSTILALLIVCSRTAWIFGCTRCQFNPSLEQEIIGNATRAADNEYVYSENVFGKENNTKSKNTENNVYNLYNESFKSNESNLYDQYGEYNQYEPYRQRYAAYPWWNKVFLHKFFKFFESLIKIFDKNINGLFSIWLTKGDK